MDSAIRWGATRAQPVLMIPGPTELPFPVVQAMNEPATIQYDMNFDVNVLEPVTLALRDIFQTRGEVIAMPGSGRTALEAAAISAIEPGDRLRRDDDIRAAPRPARQQATGHLPVADVRGDGHDPGAICGEDVFAVGVGDGVLRAGLQVGDPHPEAAEDHLIPVLDRPVRERAF